MRRKVPFVGEKTIARTSHDQDEMRKDGSAIDDSMSANTAVSSWEEDVAPEKVKDSVKPPRAAVNNPKYAPQSPPKQVKTAISEPATRTSVDWIPINNGHALRINVYGDLDQNILEEWRRLLDETADNPVSQFEFNLTQVPTISLTGLGMLLMFKERKCSERSDIKLCHCSREVWQIIEWTSMDKYFTIQGAPNPNSEH